MKPEIQLKCASIVQVAMGVVFVVANTIGLVTESMVIYAIGIWGGTLCLLAGIVGLVASVRNTRAQCKASTVLSAITSVIGFLVMIICIFERIINEDLEFSLIGGVLSYFTMSCGIFETAFAICAAIASGHLVRLHRREAMLQAAAAEQAAADATAQRKKSRDSSRASAKAPSRPPKRKEDPDDSREVRWY